MKKTLLALLLLMVLLTVSTASAEKYTPEDNIGLFVPKVLFKLFLESTLISGQTVIDYEIASNISRITKEEYWYEKYTLEGDIVVVALLDSAAERITGIGIYFPDTYTKTDTRVYEVLGGVLISTQLAYDEYDEAMSEVRKKGEYLSGSYYLDVIETDYNVEAHIDSYYWKTGETPYSRMAKYYGYCDTNYVGACVPTTEKHLMCKDIGVRNFFVVGDDKHVFDLNNNGVCCEPFIDEGI